MVRHFCSFRPLGHRKESCLQNMKDTHQGPISCIHNVLCPAQIERSLLLAKLETHTHREREREGRIQTSFTVMNRWLWMVALAPLLITGAFLGLTTVVPSLHDIDWRELVMNELKRQATPSLEADLLDADRRVLLRDRFVRLKAQLALESPESVHVWYTV